MLLTLHDEVMLQDKKNIKLLFASRLVYEKWVDILIGAIEKSMEDIQFGTYLNWYICSDGSSEKEILELVEKYPKNVKYYGKVNPEKLRELYQNADFLIMPSRFLETFGLTAMESLACGTPVIGWKKGWLNAFITDEFSIDPESLIGSLLQILKKYLNQDIPEAIDISRYDQKIWMEKLAQIFEWKEKVLLIHDYDDLIGGAEYYIDTVKKSLFSLGKEVEFFGYHGKTTPWKRRIMFITSIFAFWRGLQLRKILEQYQPDAIWMHSILRYVGIWWVWEVLRYTKKRNIPVFLSHHDVGLIAPFPQHIMEEYQIPKDASLISFIPRELSIFHKIVSVFKWWYVACLKYFLPKNTKHIIFSPFLEAHIRAHFLDQEVILLPHSVDREIFHP